MDFKGPYLEAMRDQAPAMFNRLNRTGALDKFVQDRSVEAHELYEKLTKGEARTQSGVVIDPQARQNAEEQVRAVMLDFPSPLTDGQQPAG